MRRRARAARSIFQSHSLGCVRAGSRRPGSGPPRIAPRIVPASPSPAAVVQATLRSCRRRRRPRPPPRAPIATATCTRDATVRHASPTRALNRQLPCLRGASGTRTGSRPARRAPRPSVVASSSSSSRRERLAPALDPTKNALRRVSTELCHRYTTPPLN